MPFNMQKSKYSPGLRLMLVCPLSWVKMETSPSVFSFFRYTIRTGFNGNGRNSDLSVLR